jgi:hypothetical protein
MPVSSAIISRHVTCRKNDRLLTMTTIDQFESVFKAAAKTVYAYEPVHFQSVLIVSDLEDDYQAKLFGDRVRSFLTVLEETGIEWKTAKASESQTVGALLELVEQHRPDLICTYRNLHTGAWRWPFSLGDHLDVLTQVTTTPVLVLPRPEELERVERTGEDTNAVMAVTGQLAGDHHLVNYAVKFTRTEGKVLLSHVENQAVFDRYAEVISKIPSIGTDQADEILEQLLKEPRDYFSSVQTELQEHDVSLQVENLVTLGSHVADYKRLLEEHQVDLLVLNTKDDQQMAMHGLAYALAVELRHIPLLML